jgi:hypothetical protein
VLSILGKKLIADKIERRRHMAAAIDIGVKFSAVVDQEGIDPIPLADEPEFFDRSRRELPDARDHPSRGPAFPLHSSPISQKQAPADEEAYPIECNEEEREIEGELHAEGDSTLFFIDRLANSLHFLRSLAALEAHDLH